MDFPKPISWILWIATGIYYSAIILLFTPYTHNIDEIKVAIMLSGGGILWVIYIVHLYLEPQKISCWNIFGPLLGFLAIFLISIMFSNHSWVGWFNLVFYLNTLVMLFILGTTITNYNQLIHACSVFSFLALLSCIFGYAQYFELLEYLDNWEIFTEPGWKGIAWGRNLISTFAKNHQMMGTILSTDFFAAYLIMGLPSTTALIFTAPQFYNRILGFVTAILMAGAIYLTESNETMLGVLAFLVIFFPGYVIATTDSILHRRWVAFISMAGVWVCTILYFTQSEILGRFHGIKGAFSSRGIIYQGAWDMFLEKPILGWGPGTFRMIFPQFRHQDYDINEISNVTLFPHNQFLGLLSETGILGFSLYMWFLIAICAYLINEIRKRPRTNLTVFQYAFLGGIIGIHIQNYFSPNYRWVAPAVGYNAMLGLAIASARITHISFQTKIQKPNSVTLWLKNNRPTWFVGLIILASCYVIVTWTPNGKILHIPSGPSYFNSAKYNNFAIILQQSQDNNARNARSTKDKELKQKYASNAHQLLMLCIDGFQEALEHNPTFLTSQYKLAHAYNVQQKFRLALQSYNDLHYYNPDYSEIHYNYGIIFNVLFSQSYYIDREVLLEYSEELNKRKGKNYKFDFEILNNNYNLKYNELAPKDKSKNYLMTNEDRAQITDLIKQLNTVDPAITRKKMDITNLIKKGTKGIHDKLLLDLSAYSLEYAAIKVAHKPNIWHQYLSTLLMCGRFEEGYKQAEFVYDLHGEATKAGFKPIYKWEDFTKKLPGSQQSYDHKIFQLMMQLYDKAEKKSELVQAIGRRLDDSPKNNYYIDLMLTYGPLRMPKNPGIQIPHINKLAHINPLNWRYHDKMAVHYANLARQNRNTKEFKNHLLQQIVSLLRMEKIAKDSKFILTPATLPSMNYKKNRPELTDIYNRIIRTVQILVAQEKDKNHKEILLNSGLHYTSLLIELTDDVKANDPKANLNKQAISYRNQFKALKTTLNKPSVPQKKTPVKKPNGAQVPKK